MTEKKTETPKSLPGVSLAVDSAKDAVGETASLTQNALSADEALQAAKAIILPPDSSQIVIAKGFRVSESSQGPRSKRARFTCETCKGMAYVEIPWDATALMRSQLMKEAVDEHRFLCPVGLAEDMRTYRIHYPR